MRYRRRNCHSWQVVEQAVKGRYGLWWDLDLDCGHRVERRIRLKEEPPYVLPAPMKVRCELCPEGR